MTDRTLSTVAELREVLDRVTFEPSCIDMGWRFEVRAIYARDAIDETLRPFGFVFRASFQRPDRTTGEVDRGFGRWWHVPDHVTESGLVKSAYAAVRLNVEHELLEAFHVDEIRLFDPHHSIADLESAALHHLHAEEP